MTTLADAIVAALDANWSGAGGAEPTWYNREDITSRPWESIDFVEVKGDTHTVPIEPINDVYENRHHNIVIRVSSPTSEDRLDELLNEVRRILTTAGTLTGYQVVGFSNYNYTVRPSNRKTYVVDMGLRVSEIAASGGAVSGSASTSVIGALLMYGSANAAYVPCVFEHQSTTIFSTFSGMVSNSGATDGYAIWKLPLPTTKGSLKLYVSNIRISLYDADAGDYVEATFVYGFADDSVGTLYSSATDLTTVGDKESGDELGAWGAADDCSTYVAVVVQLQFVFTNANDLEVAGVSLQCYYDT